MDIKDNAISALVGFGAGMLVTFVWLHGAEKAADAKRQVAAAQVAIKAQAALEGRSRAVEAAITNDVMENQKHVTSAHAAIAAVKPPIIIRIPAAPGQPAQVCEVNDPDALWHAFADGYNRVLQSPAAPVQAGDTGSSSSTVQP